jgi:hypothetical protein
LSSQERGETHFIVEVGSSSDPDPSFSSLESITEWTWMAIVAQLLDLSLSLGWIRCDEMRIRISDDLAPFNRMSSWNLQRPKCCLESLNSSITSCTLKSRKALERRISQICNDKNHQSVRRRLECVLQVHQHLSIDDEPKSSPSFSRPNQHQHTRSPVYPLPCCSWCVAVDHSLQGNGIDPGLDPSPNDLSADPRKQTRVDLFRLWIHVGDFGER